MAHVLQIGPAIKQYGRFHLHTGTFYKGDIVEKTNQYHVLFTDDITHCTANLGTIDIDKSNLAGLIQHLHDWLKEQRYRFASIQHMQQQTPDPTARAGLQSFLERQKQLYHHVEQALQEIEPDYHSNLPSIDLPPVTRHISPTVALRYGNFCLRAIHDYANGQHLPVTTYELSLYTPTTKTFLRIGEMPTSTSEREHVIQFVHAWLAHQQSFMNIIQKRLHESQSPEWLQQRKAMFATMEQQVEAVRAELEKLER
ncbi:hypothetical protein EI42_01024 [Thermosporothrix hazakensis]|uniref:Uncharacterized protein n=2 Tax=Thermosporothrix TaxID=768650 RepID=A0A326UEB6_THEHA|nr:hypothetical protein [Thermosporothrix hazakensis]PZW36838.1 hypothetical protein EI42_01024 [Thermosporothrix hazakensis]BBH89304.1 hypothetical protein KTC_40550 [Thermosporothrix sp. COM3]GCE47487.1 hypothetical protein KTH_23560 [Thermosporothrix hazakensis]